MTDHRQLGVDLFNETWRLIESREDDDADGRLRARLGLPLGARARVQAGEPRAQRLADLARLRASSGGRAGALPRRALLPALRALRARRLGPRATPTRRSRARAASPATARRSGSTSSWRRRSRSATPTTQAARRRPEDARRTNLSRSNQVTFELACERGPEALFVVERADHGEPHPVRADHVLRDPLHVLGGDGVEPGEQLLRLGGACPRAPRGAGRRASARSGSRSAARSGPSRARATSRARRPARARRRACGTRRAITPHRLVGAVQVDAGLRDERARVGVRAVQRVDVVREAALLAHLEEEPRRHAGAEHGAEHLQRVAIGVRERIRRDADADVRLVGLLAVQAAPAARSSAAAPPAPACRRRCPTCRRAALRASAADRRRPCPRRRRPCAAACTSRRGSS